MTKSHEPTRRRFLQGAGIATGGVVGHAFGAGLAGAAAQAPAGASPGARFRALLERPEPSRCINCGDVATARLAEMHGFEIVMTGGSALSLSKYGTGDFGTITMDDLAEFCNRTADAVDVPIIADADDGGGNPLNVYRTVQRMEKAGAACIMIEDLYGAKHLAGYDEGKIIGREAMVDKVRAAVDAKRDADTVLLVRSDVVADGGPLDEAIERVALYAQEGGDVIFVPGIPLDQCRRAVEAGRAAHPDRGPVGRRGARERRRHPVHRCDGGHRPRRRRRRDGRPRPRGEHRRRRGRQPRGPAAPGAHRQRGRRRAGAAVQCAARGRPVAARPAGRSLRRRKGADCWRVGWAVSGGRGRDLAVALGVSLVRNSYGDALRARIGE